MQHCYIAILLYCYIAILQYLTPLFHVTPLFHALRNDVLNIIGGAN